MEIEEERNKYRYAVVSLKNQIVKTVDIQSQLKEQGVSYATRNIDAIQQQYQERGTSDSFRQFNRKSKMLSEDEESEIVQYFKDNPTTSLRKFSRDTELNPQDPGHYYSSPRLSWEAKLKINNIELDLISDSEMYMMFEKQSLGSISTTGNIRYAKANNKYCTYFDETKDNNYLLYVDANNLYGESMMQKLPCRKFKFIKKLENYGETFVIFYNNRDKGYIYNVDLIYHENLHDFHNAYLLAPEQLTITHNILSQYNKDVMSNLKMKEDMKIVMGNTKKLTPNLLNNRNYVCNITNLQLYLLQGLKKEKINRIIEFDLKDFMRPYIELNTSLRQQAKNDFEKDFFKLMNNYVFDKMCENVRKRACYKLVSNEKRMRKVVKSRYFKNYIKISENLALIEKYQKVIKLNKPSCIGMQVLDLSKITMYNYHYNHIMQQNFKQVDLLMSDTDSLFLSITTQQGQDLYNNIIQKADKYDFFNVTKGDLFDKIKQNCDVKQLDLKTFLNKNTAVVGKFKNEVPDSHISCFSQIKML